MKQSGKWTPRSTIANLVAVAPFYIYLTRGYRHGIYKQYINRRVIYIKSAKRLTWKHSTAEIQGHHCRDRVGRVVGKPKKNKNKKRNRVNTGPCMRVTYLQAHSRNRSRMHHHHHHHHHHHQQQQHHPRAQLSCFFACTTESVFACTTEEPSHISSSISFFWWVKRLNRVIMKIIHVRAYPYGTKYFQGTLLT